jgi:short-subunit dehydrogenase
VKDAKTIVITGASGGLGAALARQYARPGVALHLFGRKAEMLSHIAGLCAESEARAETHVVDVTDREAMAAALLAIDAQSPVDLIIANAGISAGTLGGPEDDAQVRAIFAANVDGVLNSIQPLIAPMAQRKRGQIAIISSLAGMRALPGCPAYSASKAAVRFYGEALRGVLGKENVQVNVVCPGYIDTPMTRVNNFPMPLLMSADKAAAIIAHGLKKNRPRIAFPLALHLPLWWLACLPPALTDGFFARLPGKPPVSD